LTFELPPGRLAESSVTACCNHTPHHSSDQEKMSGYLQEPVKFHKKDLRKDIGQTRSHNNFREAAIY
jgi:hypothetical protein